MHEQEPTQSYTELQLTNVGNNESMQDILQPVDGVTSDGLTPLRKPHSENYYGSTYPDMHPDLARELAERDRQRYNRELKRRGMLGDLAISN